MQHLLVLISLILFTSCSAGFKEQIHPPGSVTYSLCSFEIEQELSNLVEGDEVNNATSTVKALFRVYPYHEKSNRRSCTRSYNFNQYNVKTSTWCFNYTIVTTCDGEILDITRNYD